MRGHCAGHAQTRIGVDVAGADEALRKLVGDVVILGQQLSRDIECHAVRPVGFDAVAHAARDFVQRAIPGDLFLADHRVQQAPFQPYRFTQMSTLGTQRAAIGGMIAVTSNRDLAMSDNLGRNATTDTAIGAGCKDRGHVPQAAFCPSTASRSR